jgi:hypothetical protein
VAILDSPDLDFELLEGRVQVLFVFMFYRHRVVFTKTPDELLNE